MQENIMESTHERRDEMDLETIAIGLSMIVNFGSLVWGASKISSKVDNLGEKVVDLGKYVNGLPIKHAVLENDHKNLTKKHDDLDREFNDFKDDVSVRVARTETVLVTP